MGEAMNARWLAVVAVAAIALGAAPSSAEGPAKKDSPRTVSSEYAVGAGIDCARTLGCVMLVPKKGEKYVHFRVQDASGTDVYGTVTDQLRSSPQLFGDGLEFCGEGSYLTSEGKPVYLYFENHLGSWHNCPGGASKGVVHASFFRR